MSAGPRATRPGQGATPTLPRADPPVEPPLRLLIVGNADSVHVQRWAGFFARRGHDVHVASLQAPADGDASAPFHVHRLGRPTTAFVRVRSLARQLRPDVVHAHNLTYYGWFARLAGVRPYAVTLWGSDVLIDVPASRLRRAWAHFVLGGAACVTADSREIIDAAVRLGAARTRVHEVQFGVDTARFSPGPRPTWLVDRLDLAGRRIVFSPRAVTPLYRTLGIVEAMRKLPDDVALVGTLAGAEPAYHTLVEEAVDRAGLADRVRLVAAIPHDEIDAYYRAADVVVSVPASDGTPVSVLEAMATGVPVVATDLAGVRPWLETIAADLLVPVDDPAATAVAIRRALDLPAADRTRIAAASRELAVMKADHTTNMVLMEALYWELARR